MTQLYVGTSGYSYKEWRGTFYPKKLASSDYLSFYAEHFSSVEVNNTFYRMPSTDMVTRWRSQVPDTFRFSIKASQRITHRKRLLDPDELLGYLFGALAELGPQLGVVLFQLPPNFRANVDRLDVFLNALPPGKTAFEFRHASWDTPEINRRLADHGAARVLVDTAESPLTTWEKTADFGYLRLRREDYASKDLARWRERIESAGWSKAFVFFKHEDEALGPTFAKSFLAS
ncbi:MAG: DUF72 domain-containing protein [Myxococcota bacterium]